MSLRSVFMLFVVGLLAACSSVSVTRVEGTPDNLTGFGSYRWGAPSLKGGERHDADLLLQDQTVRRAVAAQMLSLAFAQQPFDGVSDLVMDYQLRFTPEQYADIVQPEGGWVWKRDSDGEVQRSRVEPDVKVTVDRVALILTIYNSSREKVLWLAEANRLVGHDHPAKEMEQAIEQMVVRLFKPFPDGKN